MSQENLVLPSSGHKKIEAADSSKILVSVYLITQSHVPEHQHNLNIHQREQIYYKIFHSSQTSRQASLLTNDNSPVCGQSYIFLKDVIYYLGNNSEYIYGYYRLDTIVFQFC